MPRYSRFLFSTLLLATMAVIAGCGSVQDSASSRFRRTGSTPIRITCTTGMVADLVKNVGGKHVAVTQLMAEGIDPHTYKASSGDVSQLNEADMVFYSGLHLEANLVKVFDSLAARKPVFAVTEELHRWHPDKLIKAGGDTYDPHVWFDVSLWKSSLKVIANRLADFDPEHAAEYIANAQTYAKQLDALHEYCKMEIATIPRTRRVLVTAHDAFHYFGRAYGIEVKAPQGVSTESQASIQDIEQLIDFIVHRQIKAVFVESTVNEKYMQQVIQGCQNKGHEVQKGGELFSDAMGKPDTKEGTYEGMVRHNVETIVQALR